MKKTLFILLIGLLLAVAACTPVPPAGSEGNGGEPTVDGGGGDSGGEEIDPGGVGFSPGGDDPDSGEVDPGPRPEVRWDSDPQALIMRGNFCCGFVPQLVPFNYIPDFQIYGDGRIIWTEYDDNSGARSVFVGQLSEAEMTAILQSLVDAGFFGWKDRYEDPLVADASEQCLIVNLESQQKTVCEYVEGAPEAFHAIYDELSAGAGADGEPYIPEQGLLTSHPIDASGFDNIESIRSTEWSEAAAGFSLSAATDEGAWVEGAALESAWAAVNANPWSGWAVEGDSYYQLTIQIPGVSMIEPPAR